MGDLQRESLEASVRLTEFFNVDELENFLDALIDNKEEVYDGMCWLDTRVRFEYLVTEELKPIEHYISCLMGGGK